MREEETRSSCPSCGEKHVHPMSEVDGRFHYRCPECLWSWHRPVPARPKEA